MSTSSLPRTRRIVTAHSPHFPSTPDPSLEPSVRILIDDEYSISRQGQVWSGSVPASQHVDQDETILPGLTRKNGSSCRTTQLAPGQVTAMHRTSSLDYNIVTHGTVTLLTPRKPSTPDQWPPSSLLHSREDVEETIVHVGDVVVQRGTIHAWRNDSDQPARWTCVLTDAEPVHDLKEVWVEEGLDGKGDVRPGKGL